MLVPLILPDLPVLEGDRVALRRPLPRDVDDHLAFPIDPAEEDSHGSEWRREWDGRTRHTRSAWPPLSSRTGQARTTGRRSRTGTAWGTPGWGIAAIRFRSLRLLRSWSVASSPCGTVRGTARRIIPDRRVPSVQRPVPSLQLARTVHRAVLLVNGKSTVRMRRPRPKDEPSRTGQPAPTQAKCVRYNPRARTGRSHGTSCQAPVRRLPSTLISCRRSSSTARTWRRPGRAIRRVWDLLARYGLVVALLPTKSDVSFCLR